MAVSTSPRLVVVGASAGGVEALQRLVAELPEGFGAAVVVVLHVPATSTSVLPQILSRAGRLPAAHPKDGESFEAGRVYVAPSDCHVVVREGRLRLIRGPRENGHRPAVDPLFRSAARSVGDRAIGVILSGSRDDGTLGLAAIKQAGGVTIVQDPEEALYRGMPTSAIDHVGPDHVMRIGEIGELLRALLSEGPGGGASRREGEAMERRDPEEQRDLEHVGTREETVSSYTCPECRGTLWEVQEGKLLRLRCRVGHSYTEEAYEEEKSQALEAALWTALQTLEEKADFASRLAGRFSRAGQETTAKRYEAQRRNVLAQAELVRRAVDELDLAGVEQEQQAS